MRLFHENDVAIEPIDDRSSFEKAFVLDEEQSIPSSARGKVILINQSVRNKFGIKEGDIVWFDPRGICEIKELKLLVMDVKNLLIEVEEK